MNIEELKEFFKLYKKYYKEGLIGISETQIQLNPDKFRELFIDFTEDISVSKCADYIGLTILNDDMKFITLI